MSSSKPNRRDLEELWLNRLSDAKLRLEFARNYVIEVKQDFLSPDIPGADGHFAFRQALRAESAAFSEYNLVLRIFSDLALRGIVPDEAEWLKAQAANRSGRDGEPT